MVHYGGISCWIEIEDSSTTEYHVQTFNDQRVVTCWIASEVGKSFSVGWRNSALPAPTAGHVFMDGNDCGGRVLCGPSVACARHEGVTDARTVKRFTFSPLTLTGGASTSPHALLTTRVDDDAFLGDSPKHQKLGLIEVAIYPVEIFGYVQAMANSSSYNLPDIKLHERSKKSVNHQIKLAEPKLLPVPQNAVSHRIIGPPLVTFVFRYRPLDILRANGIAPPPPQPKRKLTVAFPRELTSDEDLSDDDEIRALRARLTALEAKRATKIRVKQEEENIPPVTGQLVGSSRKKAKLN
ncbi:hypothetical protein C8R47DRAFT_1066066 [Mycena vitilis]|nr:hypothetical protein C8R47DRAFT_1066066 [Mycena vitilis]